MRCRCDCGWSGIHSGPELLQANLMGALFCVDSFLDFSTAFILSGECLLLLLCSDGLLSFADLEFHLPSRIFELELELGFSVCLSGRTSHRSRTERTENIVIDVLNNISSFGTVLHHTMYQRIYSWWCGDVWRTGGPEQGVQWCDASC